MVTIIVLIINSISMALCSSIEAVAIIKWPVSVANQCLLLIWNQGKSDIEMSRRRISLLAIYYVINFAFQINGEHNIEHLRTKTSPEVQRQAALDVIKRLVPSFVDRVEIIIEPQAKPNYFKVNIVRLKHFLKLEL